MRAVSLTSLQWRRCWNSLRIRNRCRRMIEGPRPQIDASAHPSANVGFPASSTGRRNTLSLREKIDYRPISQRFRGGTRAAEKIALWDSWLRRGSLKAIGRPFGKPSSLFIASWPPVLRRPVETTPDSGHSAVSLECPRSAINEHMRLLVFTRPAGPLGLEYEPWHERAQE